MLECWILILVLHYSISPIVLSLLPEHLSKLLAPAFQLFVARQSHHHDLVVSHVLFEFMIDLRVKNVFAEVAENSLRFRPEKEFRE